MERRFTSSPRARASLIDGADGARSIQGYAAVFYDGTPETEFRLFDDLIERVMPGSFTEALKRQDDVRALFNHNPDHLLGRTLAGTLQLEEDETGLRYLIAPSQSGLHASVAGMIQRGDLSGSSFAFRVTDQEFKTVDGVDIREIRGVELFDVGPVTYPAYEGTSTDVRSADAARAAWRAGRSAADASRAARGRLAVARLRELDLVLGH